MTEKDKKAKQRVDDEINLKTKISKLLQDFSKKYDVELVGADIERNEFYGRFCDPQPSMYNIDFYWKFDYMAH